MEYGEESQHYSSTRRGSRTLPSGGWSENEGGPRAENFEGYANIGTYAQI